MNTPPSGSIPVQKVFDVVFGLVVMGTVGTLIGFVMGGGLMPVAIGIGLALGCVVGLLGGRRFLVSILVGTVLGGLLAWLVAGADRIWVGAGAGAAMARVALVRPGRSEATGAPGGHRRRLPSLLDLRRRHRQPLHRPPRRALLGHRVLHRDGCQREHRPALAAGAADALVPGIGACALGTTLKNRRIWPRSLEFIEPRGNGDVGIRKCCPGCCKFWIQLDCPLKLSCCLPHIGPA